MSKNSEPNVALYRKYRPSTFADIRNQDHIVKVLEGAIVKKQIPHALLFCGGRGTGKTTTARIFASAVGSSDIDIYEIDAASNRGVDDIRELREAVHTLPYESPYKVYIIDEVHMLTKEAFNALLKTLEEPPAHVLFILATTEQDKLLPTITSRCQVFTFHNPSRADLRETVIDVAKKEKFKLDAAAADLIAIAADGSFRDALGITQKVITASSDVKADADEVAAIIGAPKGKTLADVVTALNTTDTKLGLTSVHSAQGENVDMRLFMRLLLERVRLVMLLRNQAPLAETLLAQLPEEDQTSIKEMSTAVGSLNSHTLVRLLEASEQMRFASLPQLPLEIAIMELTEETKT
jgi:DNA polymerase-3 subunit gamma/tau